MITPYDVLSSSGKYPERLDSPECVIGVRINAAVLSERVSKLLAFLGVSPNVSSGFRPSSVNGAVGGAKKSAHMSGEAVDLEDADGSLARKITSAMLEQFDLYQENPQYTKGWTHLTTRRPASGSRVFNP